MCILCAFAGQEPGKLECSYAGNQSTETNVDTYAPQLPGDDGVAAESSGADSVLGSTSTSGTLSIDSSARGFVNSSGDQDWYRVTLTAGQQYTFAMNGFGNGASWDPYLRLLNASGTLITSDDDTGPLGGAKLTYTASSSGTYYISAQGWSSTTGQYLLTMNDGSTPYMPVVTAADVSDFLTNTYWEINNLQARHWGSSTVSFNVVGLEPERATLARLAFQLWSDVCSLTFVETSGSANIMLDDSNSGAYSSSGTSGNLIVSSSINVATGWYGGIDTVDSYTLQTFIHEIGHSLGLGHAGGYNGSASYGVDNSYANDTWQMSLMSYMAQNNYGGATYRFTLTPMLADILAVQEMYGAANTRTGNTVYGFGSTAGSIYDFSTYSSAPAMTIYDSGGTDTLNASGYSQNQLIDLRAGTFSNIGGLIGNIGIFSTSAIENAVGGSGSDTIYGNDAANTIRGNAGNDTIDGGAGTDYAVFSGMRSAYTLAALGGTSVRVVGADGTDTLTGVEYLVFDDQTVTWAPATLPDLDAGGLSLSVTTMTPGGATTVSYSVSNLGSAAAAATTVGIYLSNDAVFDGSDTLLLTRATPSIGAGGLFSDTVAVTLTSSGYVIVVADYNNGISNEVNENNNPSNAVQVTVVAPVTLNGGPGTDTLSGAAAGDTLRGFGGDDVLTGAGGNDTLDGGAGDDSAVFSQGLGSYSVRDLGYRIEVSGPDGTDTLTGIEHLRFADGTVHVDDGSMLFDTLFYMRNNLDVFHSGANAFQHFSSFGWHEGRNPNEFFDAQWYLMVNPDVRATGANPLEHYQSTGWREGRDPGPNFDVKSYLLHNPDVAAVGVEPLAHYLMAGRAEGRVAHEAIGNSVAGFDAQFYLEHNRDVAAAGVDPLWHFNNHGWKEGRNPNAMFDTAGYLSHYADVAASGMNPLAHYEQYGWKEGRDPSSWFDTDGYLAHNPDVVGWNPLDHYLQAGVFEGRNPVNDGHWG